ncbi:MAG: 16S rRNA (cytidine(1402)-2'-O)-methyltransferase [Anaerolineales bacterium]|nr:16S rRNA (cytidine(1402)-2'-O)-methyltransferase [Anaerolineales bacterium]
MGTLYVVATPIGNLEDLTLRARRVLGEVALIAAEDTRRTRQLLNHLGLHTPTLSYFEHNKLARLDQILAALDTGDVALVSDAGTPAISDPGQELVRATLDAGHTVVPVPGASAVLATLVASGLSTAAFYFVGFLPRRGVERREALTGVATAQATLIFYESPHRLAEMLEDALTVLGDRPAVVAREVTKLHETFVRGSLSTCLAAYKDTAVLGEVTVLIAGAAPVSDRRWEEAEVRAELARRLAAGARRREAAKAVADLAGWTPKEIYGLDL